MKFIVRYPVTTYHCVEVERDENITEEALLDSITRDDLAEGYADQNNSWDSLKEAWREGDAECFTDDGTDIELAFYS